MATFRSRRLEQIFGAPLSSVTYEQVLSLKVNGVTEAPDLDFKGELYGGNDEAKRALSGDVAALANSGGGVLLLGVMQDEQARAADTPGVDISDAQINRIHQTVASGVAPLPSFDVLPVEDPSRPGHGFLLIIVPPSTMAPHAVLVNKGLRYPRRFGTTITYLTEADIASAYRARFAGIAARMDAAKTIENDFIATLDLGSQTFIVVTLLPDHPGDLQLSKQAFQAFQTDVVGKGISILLGGTYFDQATTRRRRLVASHRTEASPLARWLACELFTDGAGAVALIGDVRDGQGGQPKTVSELGDERVVDAIMSGLRFLGRHARDRVGVGGLATARVTVAPVTVDLPARLIHTRQGFGDALGRQGVTIPPESEAVVDIDEVAEDGPSLLSVTRQLAGELFQDFGHPEVLQLTAEGAMRWPYWNSHARNRVKAWAEASGVEILNETVQ